MRVGVLVRVGVRVKVRVRVRPEGGMPPMQPPMGDIGRYREI